LERRKAVRALIEFLATAAFIASPAAAQTANTSSSASGKATSRTVVAKGAKSTATMTVTTKVSPNTRSGRDHKKSTSKPAATTTSTKS
jgi:hypothetical protein